MSISSVPDTNTFSLTNVTASVYSTAGNLSTCFSEAVTAKFDPAYSGSKNQLDDFRNYAGSRWKEIIISGHTGDATWTCGDLSGDGLSIVAIDNSTRIHQIRGYIFTHTDIANAYTSSCAMSYLYSDEAIYDFFPKVLVGFDGNYMNTFWSGNWIIHSTLGTAVWQCCAISDNGDTALAGNTASLYVGAWGGSNDWLWTEVYPAGAATDRNWKCCAIDSTGNHMLVGAYDGRLYSSNNAGTSWTERQPAGSVDCHWVACDVSANSTHFIASIGGAVGGRIYSSHDTGTSWSEETPAGSTDQVWSDCSLNYNGSIMTACTNGYGRLYSKNDSTWSEETPAGSVDKDWRFFSLSNDGTKMLAGDHGGRLWYKNISSWWEQDLTTGNWKGCATNFDGSIIFVTGYGGYLYLKVGGIWHIMHDTSISNWRCCDVSYEGTVLLFGVEGEFLYSKYHGHYQQQELTTGNWISCAASSFGDKMIACDYGGDFHIKTGGYGGTWSIPAGFVTPQNWSCCAISKDGNIMLVGAMGGRLWISSTAGDDWDDTLAAGNVNSRWFCCSISSDGTKMMGGVNGGKLYYHDGISWAIDQPDSGATYSWVSCDMSFDGGVRIATTSTGRIYVCRGGTWSAENVTGTTTFETFNSCAASQDGTLLLAGTDTSFYVKNESL